MAHERHSFLLIFRFNMDDEQNPLRCGVVASDNRLVRMQPGRSFLIVGIVDSSKRSATTPMMHIPLVGSALRGYTRILERVEQLNQLYRETRGYLADPTLFGEEQKAAVLDTINTTGSQIYGLLQGDESNIIRDWLEKLFRETIAEPEAMELAHHVTIVTNDFSIPWYWLKPVSQDRFLCEIASLGMLQLATYSAGPQAEKDDYWRKRVEQENLYGALLINGSPELPFAKAELEAIRSELSREVLEAGRRVPRFEAEEVDSATQLALIRQKYRRGQRIERFRVVHFTGHYSSNELLLNGTPIDERDDLDKFIDRSVLVLDGCSSSQGLRAWTDMESVTARLIALGAIGCVATVLPVKNDPILAEVFWGTFYRELRVNQASIGQALGRARRILKEELDLMGSKNPAWILYQLIGNPSVELFSD